MFSSKPFTFVWFIKIVLSCRFFRLLSRSSAHSMHESCPVLYVSRQYSEPDSLLSSHWEIKGELKPSWPENVKKKKKEEEEDRQKQTNKQTNKQRKKEECKWLMSISRFHCLFVVSIITCTVEVLFFCFEFELIRPLPAMFCGSLSTNEKQKEIDAWRSLICLPHIPVLFMTSATQTAQQKTITF